MKYFASLVLALVVTCSVQTFAYSPEEGKVNLIVAPTYFKTNFDGARSGAETPYKTGLALIALGDVSDHGSLEIGIFFLQKQYFREYQGGYIGAESSVIHITTGYHFWHTPYLSSSLAVYSAYPFGAAKTVHNSLPPVSEIVETSVSDNSEFGLEAALQGEFLTTGKFALVAELRYAYSLTHKSSERADHYGGLIGIRYLIQEEKVKKERPKTAL